MDDMKINIKKVLSQFNRTGFHRWMCEYLDDTEDVPYPTDEEIKLAFEFDRDPFEDETYLLRVKAFYLANPDRFTPNGEVIRKRK